MVSGSFGGCVVSGAQTVVWIVAAAFVIGIVLLAWCACAAAGQADDRAEAARARAEGWRPDQADSQHREAL